MVTEDQRQQVTSYLHAQAAKLSTEELLVKRQTEVDRLLAEVGGMGEEEARWAPEGEWSALQILDHVADSFADYRNRIARLSGHRLSDVPPRRSEGSVGALSRLIQQEHGKTQKLILAAGDAPTTATDESDRFGPLNWREWALFERVHMLDHVNQVRALKEAMPGAGS